MTEANIISGIILTLPIVKGKAEAWRRFCQELSGTRRLEHEAARLQQGITCERLALIETAYGATAVTTFEAVDLSLALNQLRISKQPFDRWYRQQIQILHGIDLTSYELFSPQIPLPDNQELLFEWILPPTKNNGRKSG